MKYDRMGNYTSCTQPIVNIEYTGAVPLGLKKATASTRDYGNYVEVVYTAEIGAKYQNNGVEYQINYGQVNGRFKIYK